jgi:hypothetical protein
LVVRDSWVLFSHGKELCGQAFDEGVVCVDCLQWAVLGSNYSFVYYYAESCMDVIDTTIPLGRLLWTSA